MSDVPRRLYLAGPMSGYAEHNFPEFNRAAALLRAEGYQVFNPAENADDGVRRPRSFYMRRDIPALMDCDAIAALPNWQQSRGACLEMWIAVDLDMPIFNCRLRDGSVFLELDKTIDITTLPFSRESDAHRQERQPTDPRVTAAAGKTEGAAVLDTPPPAERARREATAGFARYGESRISLREAADGLPAAGRSLL